MIDRVLCGTSVTRAYSAKAAKKDAQNHASTGPLNLHDRPLMMIGKCCHIILPTAQTLSLPDFDLFPKLKKSIRATILYLLKELSTASIQVIRQMKRHHIVDGIVKLPRRLNLVIEEHEDYIEGL